MNFDDELDSLNDDGFDSYEPTLEDLAEMNEWFDSRDPAYPEDLDPDSEDNYDPEESDENEPSEEADHLDRYDEDWDWDGDDAPIGLEYDGYNDPEDY